MCSGCGKFWENRNKGFTPFIIGKEAKAMYVEEPEKQTANGQPIVGVPFAVCFLWHSIVLLRRTEALPEVGPHSGDCAPTRTGSQEKRLQITAVRRCGNPHRSRAPNPSRNSDKQAISRFPQTPKHRRAASAAALQQQARPLYSSTATAIFCWQSVSADRFGKGCGSGS